MEVQIDVVTGFLESGKTSFIQSLLERDVIAAGRPTVLLVCEEGLEEYDPEQLKAKNITLVTADDPNTLNQTFFQNLIGTHKPHRILVEYNGTWKIGSLLKIKLPDGCRINSIVGLVDASTFETYMSNMSRMMAEQLANCDVIFVNRFEELEPEQADIIRRSLKNINRKAEKAFFKNRIPKNILKRYFMIAGPSLWKVAKGFLVVFLFWAVVMYFQAVQALALENQYTFLQSVNTIFISILLQAIPFVLIGVFTSSILQVFVSDTLLVRLFTKHRLLGAPLAVVLGVFFPVCDCAMAPVVARMVRKGVPLSYAVTFLLAAPVVNPVVIWSTLYAFPGQPRIVLLRVVWGILVALIAGLLIPLLWKKGLPVQRTIIDSTCASGYIGDSSSEGFRGKLEILFRHAGMEFFNVGRYVVAGALISSVLQVLVPKTALLGTAQNVVLAPLAMLVAAFLMSVCSTSNAFIARSFSYTFPIGSVLGFMVMGPMLDLKNLLMLMSGFRRGFVLRLAGLLAVIGWIGFVTATIAGQGVL
ncbi:permease [Marasmitruncus massiliensis]|uniref:permease n=1 Tax=Marasmitruncus massiliensis TaxID=1944642 RepID=UPI000C7DCFAE|nr:permease [Marasmitruncus massiliensis]